MIGNNNVVVDEVCLNDWGFYEGEHRATGTVGPDEMEEPTAEKGPDEATGSGPRRWAFNIGSGLRSETATEDVVACITTAQLGGYWGLGSFAH